MFVNIMVCLLVARPRNFERRITTMSTISGIVFAWIIMIGTSDVRVNAAPDSGILSGPLAVKGMVQGLLNMQVRPEGGFFEEKYTNIFKDADKLLPSAEYESLLGVDIKELLNKTPKETLSDDGKLLRMSARNRSPNPCFEYDRITRNRLLALVCSLQVRKNLDRAWV